MDTYANPTDFAFTSETFNRDSFIEAMSAMYDIDFLESDFLVAPSHDWKIVLRKETIASILQVDNRTLIHDDLTVRIVFWKMLTP